MPVRLKKLIGLVGILAFLGLYVVLVSTVSDHIPDHWAARLAFYGLAGALWGIPLFPLLSWMERKPR